MRAGYVTAVFALLAMAGCTSESQPVDREPPCNQVKAHPEKYTKADAERCKDFHWEDTNRKKRY